MAAIGAALGLGLAVAAFADAGHEGTEQHGHQGMHMDMGKGGPGARSGNAAMTPEQRNAMRDSMRKATPEQRQQMMAAMHEGMHKGGHAHGMHDGGRPNAGSAQQAPTESEHKH